MVFGDDRVRVFFKVHEGENGECITLVINTPSPLSTSQPTGSNLETSENAKNQDAKTPIEAAPSTQQQQPATVKKRLFMVIPKSTESE